MARLTPEQAIARLQPQGKRKEKGAKALELIATIGVADDDVYILGNADGGILTPAYDNIRPIIATWEGGDEIPPALEDWLQEYAREIEWWQNVGEELQSKEPSMTKAPAKPRESIPVMLETKWSQKSPYNDLLVFDGKKCVTGCNTTAAAQLLYHWYKFGYFRGCPPTPAYDTLTNGYRVDALPPIVTFDYKNLVKKPSTAAQKTAVAKMMQYIGYALKSDFKPNSTGAAPKDLSIFLRDSLHMGDGIAYIYASKGAVKYEKAIYEDILAKRPVLISGWTTKGGGHTFIADGYDAEQDLYHINWGWGGSYDGWFAISALNATSSYAYNSNKVAIIGIQPDYKLGDINGDGNVDIADVMQVVQDAQQGRYSDKADINNDGQVTVTDAMVILDRIVGKI